MAYSFQRGMLQGGYRLPAVAVHRAPAGRWRQRCWRIGRPLDVAGDPEAVMAAEDPAALLAACEKVVASVVADNAAGTVTFNLVQPWAPFLATVAQQLGR